MSYDSIEISTDRAKPIFLYEIIYDDNPGSAYRYVAGVNKIVAIGKTWWPQSIKHSAITSSGSLDKQSLTVTARKDIEAGALFLSAPPSRVVQLNIYRGHPDEQAFVMEWTGRIIAPQWKGPEIEFSCEPISTSLVNIGLRRKYQLGCPHTLYGKSCGASRLANTESGSLQAVENPAQIIVAFTGAVAGLTPANLIGGPFSITLTSGRVALRSIISAQLLGSRTYRLRLMSYIPEMLPGQKISAAKGCPHTFAGCRDIFGNVANYGGCPNIPQKNPFQANQF